MKTHYFLALLILISGASAIYVEQITPTAYYGTITVNSNYTDVPFYNYRSEINAGATGNLIQIKSGFNLTPINLTIPETCALNDGTLDLAFYGKYTQVTSFEWNVSAMAACRNEDENFQLIYEENDLIIAGSLGAVGNLTTQDGLFSVVVDGNYETGRVCRLLVSGGTCVNLVFNSSATIYDAMLFDVRLFWLQNSTITVNAKDQNTLANITAFTAQIIGGDYIANSSTTNGTITFTELENKDYILTVNAPTYTPKQYVISTENNEETNQIAYLNQYTESTTFTVEAATGVNAGQPINAAVVTWESIIGSSYVITESKYTDISGTAGPFYYNETSAYRITVTAEGYTSKQFTLNPVQFASYEVRLLSSTAFENNQDYQGISFLLQPSEYTALEQNNFSMLISSPTNTLTSYNYTVTYPGGTVSGSGNTPIGETLTNSFNITGATSNSTVTVNYCYETTQLKCFSRTYPITGVYGNNTIKSQLGSNTEISNLEKIVFATIGTGAIVGVTTLVGGPITGGATWIIVMGLMYLALDFNLWLLLIPAFLGLGIIAFRSNMQ